MPLSPRTEEGYPEEEGGGNPGARGARRQGEGGKKRFLSNHICAIVGFRAVRQRTFDTRRHPFFIEENGNYRTTITFRVIGWMAWDTGNGPHLRDKT